MPTTYPPPSVVQPSDTTLPGLSRRRVWTDPELVSHSLLVLTLPRLYLAPAGQHLKPEALAALENTLNIEHLVGPLATVVEMPQVRRVKLDLPTNTLAIDYQAAHGASARVTVVCQDPQVADDVFTKLWRRLGPQFVIRQSREDPWVVARVPIVFIAAILMFTGMIATFLNGILDLNLARDWPIAEDLPSWQLVCMLSGAVVACAQILLYRRLTQPPDSLELLPDGYA